MLTFNEKGEAIVIEKRRVKGTFLENLELNDFPFDVQVCKALHIRNYRLSGISLTAVLHPKNSRDIDNLLLQANTCLTVILLRRVFCTTTICMICPSY